MADPSDLVYLMNIGRIVEINYIATAALICYDYCLTFDREVRQMWKNAWSSSSLLFYAIRYPALFSTIFVILDLTSWKGISNESCVILVRTEMVMNIILLTAAAAFSSLRAYALCDGSRWIFAVVLTLSLVNPAISIYTFVAATPVLATVPFKACGYDVEIAPETYENWMVGARASAVIVDVIVLAITWMRTWTMRTEAVRIDSKATFTATLMRDGTMYFFVLLVTNLIGLGLCRQIQLLEPMSTWTAIFTAILTSRFILDLHEASEGLAGVSDTQLGGLPTQPPLVFRPSSGSRGRRGVYGTILTETQLSSIWETGWDETQLSPTEDDKVIKIGVHSETWELESIRSVNTVRRVSQMSGVGRAV